MNSDFFNAGFLLGTLFGWLLSVSIYGVVCWLASRSTRRVLEKGERRSATWPLGHLPFGGVEKIETERR